MLISGFLSLILPLNRFDRFSRLGGRTSGHQELAIRGVSEPAISA